MRHESALLRADLTIPGLILTAVVLLLFGLDYIVDDLEQGDRSNSSAAMQREIELLGSLITGDLRLGNYQHVEQILKDWGASNPDVEVLSLVAANGFQISEYRRPLAALEKFQLDMPISFSYSGSAVLTLSKDISHISQRHNDTLIRLAAALLVVTLLLSSLAWLVWVNRRKAYILQRQREELKRYAQVVESSSDMLFMLDQKLRYQVVNPAYARQMGCQSDKLIGRSILSVVGPKEYVSIEDHLKQVLAGKPQLFTCDREFPSGEHRIIDAKYSPFLHDGKIAGVVGSLHDITERKQAEEEIRLNLIEQEILSWIVHLALSPISFEELLEKSLSKLLTHHNLSFLAKGSIFIFDHKSGELVLTAQQDLAEDLLSQCTRVPLGYCLCGRAGASKQVVFADHVDERHETHYPGIKPHGHYCIPILGDGDLLGVLNLYTPAGHVRTEQEELFVTTIAATLATIIRWRQAEKLLKESEERYSRILDNALDGIIIIDDVGDVVLFNPSARKMFGIDEEDVVGKAVAELVIPPDMRARHRKGMQRYLQSGKSEIVGRRVERTAMRTDGDEFPASMAVSTFEMDNRAYFAAFVRDISAQKQAGEQIHTLSQAIEQSPVSVIITDPDARIEYVNSNFEQATGYAASEVIGKNPSILQSGQTPSACFKELWAALEDGKPWRGEFINRRKSGEIFCERAHIAPVFGNSGEVLHYLAVKEDITQYKQQEERILHQAHYDNLTNLPNRFLALDRLAQLINEARRAENRVAVLFLDLDGFKKINDTLGHEAGDKLLIQVAKRLQQTIRKGDTVGRLGGDEFIVLLDGLHEVVDARPVAENLLHHFRTPFVVGDRELLLTISIGIACYPDDGESSADLLSNADIAMYHSKKLGRNTYHYFTNSMNQGVSRRMELEERLPGALERGEISLHYQPMFEIIGQNLEPVVSDEMRRDIEINRQYRMVGAEALLRWDNPELGIVSAEEFISIAEQTGLILPIGAYVISEALRAAAKWRNDQPEFCIHMNLSTRQLRDPGLLPLVEDALQKYALPGEVLVMEITETMLMSGHSYIEQVLSGLRGLGVRLTMDNFGSGYSSLNQLRQYPFDTLKIDRIFIAGMQHDQADLALVDAAIAMAHGMKIKVIAEGVETEQQLTRLVTRECDIAQGYLFSVPLEGQEMERFIKERV